MRRAFLFALGIAFATPALPAQADDASEAALHFELGSDLYRRRRYDEALEHFLAANRLVPNPSYAFNIAQTYELMRRWGDAYNWYETFAIAPSIDAQERDDARARQARLAPRVAVIDIRSEPAGAAIHIDRRELGSVGLAPRRVAVSAGERVVLLSLEGHHDARIEVLAELGSTVDAQAALASLTGRLRVESSPPGAEVRLADSPDSLGHTPLDVELPAGEHAIVVTREGHVTERRRVAIRADDLSELSLALSRDAATVATLTVDFDPPGAEVLLDGEVLGITPMTLDGLAAGGGRALSIRAAGHEGWARSIALEAGAATHVRGRLRDHGDEPWEGIAWIGYLSGGALVASAAALGLTSLGMREAFFGALYANPTRGELDRISELALAADIVGALAGAVLTATFVWDLATGPAPPSSGEVEVER